MNFVLCKFIHLRYRAVEAQTLHQIQHGHHRQLTSTQKNSGTGTPGLLSIPCPQGIAHSDAGSHTKAKGHLGISNQKSQLIKGGGGPDANAVGSNHMETSDRLYNLGSREGSYCIQAV